MTVFDKVFQRKGNQVLFTSTKQSRTIDLSMKRRDVPNNDMINLVNAGIRSLGHFAYQVNIIQVSSVA